MITTCNRSSTIIDCPHILLVEPDIFLASIYEKNLLMEEFHVTKVESGERAMTILKNKKIDLILLAITLPNVNGLEILKQIKKDKKLSSVYIIILSKLGTKNDIEKAYALGADGYIIKTHFRPSEIMKKIKKLLIK